MAIGRVLRRARNERGLNQSEAATRAGISQQVLSKIERGARKGVDLTNVTRLAAVFEMDREQVLMEAAKLTGARLPSNVVGLRDNDRAFGRYPGAAADVVPLNDRIQQGAWVRSGGSRPDASRAYGVLRDPRYPRADQWLAQMVGDLAGGLGVQDGDLVHLVADDGYYPKSGDVVLVERDDRGTERSLREVQVTPTGVLLWARNGGDDDRLELADPNALAGPEPLARIVALVVATIRRF